MVDIAYRVRLDGEVLELGSGAGVPAEELLARFPSIRLAATDVDPSTVETGRQRLGPFADRVEVRLADATHLPFPDGRFDAVLSFIMLAATGSSITVTHCDRRPIPRRGS
jgi:ubiquinone/menaquinone biosynthesis C-methylase UbiE